MKHDMTQFGVGVFLLLCTFWKNAECIGGAKEMDTLLKKLFEGYNPLVRPSHNYSTPTDVNIELYVTVVLGLETKRQLLFLRAYLRISWTDELLQWNQTQHGDIDRIVVPQDIIWKPDIMLYNAANENDRLGNENVFIAVNSKGTARWDPPFYLESTCKVDMSKYPFDVSVCPVDVTSWNDDNRTFVFRWPDNPVHLELMLVNGEYEISSAGVLKHTNEFEELFYEMVTFNIRLARRPAYIAVSLLIPVNLLAVLSILSFLMPADEPEKVNISVTVLLSFTVFLSFIDSNIPPNSDNISLLVIYISMLLVMSFLSVVGNILVVVSQQWNESPQTDQMQLYIMADNKAQSLTEHTGKGKCISERPFSANKPSRCLSSQLNRAFFILSGIFFVLISCLMLALIRM